VNFLGIPERINKALYKKDVYQLTRKDLDLAKKWTLALIRDGHPHWNETQVNNYYEKLSKVRVELIDQWSAKNGWNGNS